AILAARSNPLTVGTKRGTENGGLMAQGAQGLAPQPLEVVPFPAAQVLRALGEQLFHPAKVIRRPLEMRRGNALVVRVAALALEGLLQLLVFLPDERATDRQGH